MYVTLCKVTLTSSRFFLLPAASLIVLVLLGLSVGTVCAETGAVDTANGVDSVDCCYRTIGDYVWFDMNGNGLQDEGVEAGINGIRVELLTGNGSFIEFATTADNNEGKPGYYFFKDIEDNHYYIVKFVLPSNSTWVFTAQDRGADDIDSDADPTTGQTANFKLECADNLTLDAGLIRLDLGDLPEQYPIVKRLAQPGDQPEDGARHIVWDMDGDATPDLPGAVWMGEIADAEQDATHCPKAQTDDNRCAGGTYDPDEDDEDGVTLDASKWVQGNSPDNKVSVSVSGILPAATAYLAGWVDWGSDGSFDQAYDWIIGETLTVSGSPHEISFTGGRYPTGQSSYGTLNMRFRLFTSEDDARELGQSTTSRSIGSASTTGPTGDAIANAYSGLAINGEVEDYQATNDPLAVTISYFLATEEGDEVQFTWQTATENSLAGFNLLADMDDAKRTLNPELIPSLVIDSVTPTNYSYSTATTATSFYVHKVGINGSNQETGPYVLGVAHGAFSGSDPLGEDERIFLPLIIK